MLTPDGACSHGETPLIPVIDPSAANQYRYCAVARENRGIITSALLSSYDGSVTRNITNIVWNAAQPSIRFLKLNLKCKAGRAEGGYTITFVVQRG